MCASCITLLLILLVPFSMRMVTEGLPAFRRERGAHQDIIAGADFLSVLMESPAVRQAYRELFSTTAPTTTFRTTSQISSNGQYIESNTPFIREQRSSRSTTLAEPRLFTKIPNYFGASVSDRTILNNLNATKLATDNSKSNGSLIISVQVSSSEGDTHINKVPHESKSSTVMGATSKHITPIDQTVMSSEDHPSIIVKSSKSEFSVDEREPITSNDGSYDDYTQEYPANVQSIPSPQVSSKGTLQHHSVIYHDNLDEPIRGRSVSYSAVIQTLPKRPILKTWKSDNKEQKDRQERHYEIRDLPTDNQFEKSDVKNSNENVSKDNFSNSAAESSNYFVTSKYDPSLYYSKIPNGLKGNAWEKLGESYAVTESPQEQNRGTTENPWTVSGNEMSQERPQYTTTKTSKPQRIPLIYGNPEQNYEVDEAVSVMTNGRAHGVQSFKKHQASTPMVEIKTGQSNDSQKVGYVVEGRNYRKYRVEERTSDGFIVGEYGVVSHDNGALRGVRYTADGTVNPRLIYDALMKFLSL